MLDRGQGIPGAIAGRVHEPFFTTKATGTGLGLAVVKEIVESHHGTFELASTPGQGTRATVLVPVEP